jgi:periplasmic protein TonB
MSFSGRSWLLALGLAITSHGLVFLIVKPTSEAKIERSAGPAVTINGSLSSLATQMKAVTTVQTVEPVMAKAVAVVEPVMQVAAIEPVITQAIIPAQKIKPVKPKLQKQVVIKKEIVKKKVDKKKIRMAQLVQKKLRRKKVEKKRKAAKLRERAKAKAKAKANRRGGRMAAVRRGGGGKGRQSKVAGRAKLSNYKGRVRARVAGRAHSSSRGSSVVSFTVTSGGGVRGISVSGGSSAQKSAARRAASGGFPPIPSGVGLRSIRFTVRINFR